MQSLSSVHDVQKLEGYCRTMLEKYGTITGNTLERPVIGEFIIPPSSLNILTDNLEPLLDADVFARETEEYSEIIDEVVRVCGVEFIRDISSRRAVVVNNGCFTYQHLYLREGVLFHVVHMRGQDVRKMLADFWLIFQVQKEVMASCIPESTIIKNIQLRWSVDCFHKYLNPAEVPL